MQIIPVIDLMGGIVVHAQHGQRDKYRTINSELCPSAEPKEFVRALLDFHPFKTIYLADLDAITSGVLNKELYLSLVDAFPEVVFWLDAGVRTSEQWFALKAIDKLTIILASETIEDLSLLPRADVFSVDFKQNAMLGDPALFQNTTVWPEKVIVLCLDDVGSSNGPNIELLEHVKASAPGSHQFIVGGGVRGAADLAELKNKNVSAALVSSALHKGDIGKKLLCQYQ